jgi:type I restriction enzyme S subunit
MHLLITLLKNMNNKNNNNNLPKGWRKVKLGEIVNVSGGGTPSTSNPKYWGGNIAWLTPAEVVALNGNRFIDKTERYITEEGLKNSSAKVMPVNSLLLTSRATIGEVVINKIPMATNQGFINIEPKNVDLMFLFYWLKNNRKFLNQMAIGSTFNELSKSVFKKIDILIPEDINEQKRIAEILSAFDDKIEVNNKIIKTLEEMAQEVFKEWILKNQKSKVKSQKLGDLADIKYGKGPAANKLKKSGYPVYGANGVIGYSDSYDFSERQIIIGCRGVVGNVTLTLPNCAVTHNSLIITPRNNKKIFFYYLLKNQNLDAVVGGSAQPQITIKDLEQLELPIVDENLQNKFDSMVGNIEQKKLFSFFENQKLVALRDLLLPKLMSGEIKI